MVKTLDDAMRNYRKALRKAINLEAEARKNYGEDLFQYPQDLQQELVDTNRYLSGMEAVLSLTQDEIKTEISSLSQESSADHKAG